jgi:hypothetical protein
MKCRLFFIFEKSRSEGIFVHPIWKSIVRSEIVVLNLCSICGKSRANLSCHFVKFLIIIMLPLPLLVRFESFVYVLLIPPPHPRPCLTPPTPPSQSNSSMLAISQSNPSLRLVQTVCLPFNATKVRPNLRVSNPLSYASLQMRIAQCPRTMTCKTALQVPRTPSFSIGS